MSLLLAVICTALIFEFVNGFHDTANSVAAAVGTRALTPTQAIALAAVMNLCGALAGTAVATTVGKGLVEASYITNHALLCALIASTLWNLITWRLGLPSSSSHGLFGGLVGAAVAAAGTWSVVIWSAPVPGKPWYEWGGLLNKVVLPMFLSPLIGFLAGFLVMALLYVMLRRARPSKVNIRFRKLQIVSAAFMGFSHGSNDAQKTMGIISLALFSATQAGLFVNSELAWLQMKIFHIPIWVKVLCAITMAGGTAAGGRRIIRTLGRKLGRLQPANGFAADMTSASVLMSTAVLGMPVSTTHVVSSAIMGVGTARNGNALRWDIVRSILYTWVLTVPVTALLAYGLMSCLR
jgi:PiT family inorganic phosphate transporter